MRSLVVTMKKVDIPSCIAVQRYPSYADHYLNGTRLVNKKEPISADMIKKIVEASNVDNLLELRNVCIFILVFAGFFRIEEVLHIKYGDICFHTCYVAINVDKSKTDQLRKGNEVVISEGPMELVQLRF